jgi:flagellar basal body-associated protein FliL
VLENSPVSYSGDIPTQFIPRPQITNSIPVSSAPKDTSKWLFLIIGVLATAVVGMGIFMFVSRDKDDKKETANQNAKTENTAGNNNSAENETAKNTQTNAPKTNSTTEKPKINPNLNPAGSWSGDWNSVGKYTTYFTATLNLTDDGAGKVNGHIVWTLQRTDNPKKTDKIGTSATEYVQGTYNPATRTVSLRGIRKDDAYDIVILDRYILILAENNLTMSGKTRGGNFSLRR